jgi:glycerol-3-phosphate cytidylyltransferase-like family protein
MAEWARPGGGARLLDVDQRVVGAQKVASFNTTAVHAGHDEFLVQAQKHGVDVGHVLVVVAFDDYAVLILGGV